MGHTYNMKNQFWAGLGSRPVHEKKSLGPIMSNFWVFLFLFSRAKKIEIIASVLKSCIEKKLFDIHHVICGQLTLTLNSTLVSSLMFVIGLVCIPFVLHPISSNNILFFLVWTSYLDFSSTKLLWKLKLSNLTSYFH